MKLFNVGRALFNGLPWSKITGKGSVANAVLCGGWDTRIRKAEETGHFTEDDRERGATWTRCCIGELRRQHGMFRPTPAGAHGGTDDDKLNSLGVRFTIAVRDGDIKGARKVHTDIIERAANLLREEVTA